MASIRICKDEIKKIKNSSEVVVSSCCGEDCECGPDCQCHNDEHEKEEWDDD